MKTIAVVTIPLGNMTPEQNSNVTTSIKESLPDYNVIVFASSRAEKILIEFYSPELQAGLKKETCGIRNYTIIDTEKMMQGVNSIPRRNR